ncbi:MAG: lipocalin family protein [Pyrinomonadaceae bacterium]
MRKLLFAGFVAALLMTAVSAQTNASKTNLETVPSVDLKRYAGTWYEIARYPNKFEKNCVGNVTTTYTLKDDGNLEVLNKCLKKNGKINNVKGEAKVIDKTTNAKLKLRFAPGFPSFLPKAWEFNYWIFNLAPDYSYSLVSDSERNYLWILSRTPQMDTATYENILHTVERQGFVPNKLVKTPQKVETIKGTVLQKH